MDAQLPQRRFIARGRALATRRQQQQNHQDEKPRGIASGAMPVSNPADISNLVSSFSSSCIASLNHNNGHKASLSSPPISPAPAHNSLIMTTEHKYDYQNQYGINNFDDDDGLDEWHSPKIGRKLINGASCLTPSSSLNSSVNSQKKVDDSSSPGVGVGSSAPCSMHKLTSSFNNASNFKSQQHQPQPKFNYKKKNNNNINFNNNNNNNDNNTKIIKNSSATVNAIMKGQQPDSSDDDDQCPVCDRPDRMILCRTCGHLWKGRKKNYCETHRTYFLMDHESCTKAECKSKDIKEI